MLEQKIILVSLLLLLFSPSYTQEKLELEGAVILSTTDNPTPQPGTIRWTGSDFQGWNGIIWISLTGNTSVDSLMDIDSNVYKTIRLGNQEWMIENLKVTRYKDGTVIDQITNQLTWSGLTTGAWCWYDNDHTYDSLYGKLYNWYAVNSGMLCPTGWHIPSEGEWIFLGEYLGGQALAGVKIKEIGVSNWKSPNTGATNESGFTGVPGGRRSSGGPFNLISDYAFWWSRTVESTSNAIYAYIIFIDTALYRSDIDKTYGLSVRCLKDY